MLLRMMYLSAAGRPVPDAGLVRRRRPRRRLGERRPEGAGPHQANPDNRSGVTRCMPYRHEPPDHVEGDLRRKPGPQAPPIRVGRCSGCTPRPPALSRQGPRRSSGSRGSSATSQHFRLATCRRLISDLVRLNHLRPQGAALPGLGHRSRPGRIRRPIGRTRSMTWPNTAALPANQRDAIRRTNAMRLFGP